MKKLIKRCQEGNSISWADVGDAASYMIPVYGTYRSFKDAVDDPSLANWGLAGLSLVGDIATLAGGAGLALKGIKSGSKAAKAYLEVAGNYERLASEIAKEASKINPKSSAKALKKADNLANDAIGTWQTALDYRAIAAKEKQGVIRAVGDAGKIAAGSAAAFKGPKAVDKASELDRNKRQSSTQKKTLKKTLKKVTPSNGDLVRKRTEPFLYNNFLKKDGGTMNLISKYQDGGKNPLIETAKYVTPVVGSYYSIIDAIDDPSWQNILSAGGSVAGDLLLLTGVGAAAKIPGALKALNNARKAQKAIELTAANAGKLAKSYAAAGDMKKVNLILDGVKAYYNCASDIGLKLDNLRNAYETVLSIALTGIKAGVVAKGLNSGTKIAALELTKKQNLVEKRQDSSWLYNDFSNTEQHKNGGIMKNLIPKHQDGRRIEYGSSTNLPQVNLPEVTVRGTKLPLLPAMIVDRYYEGNLPSGLYASTKNNPDRSLLYVKPSITAKNRAAQTILKTQIDNIEKQKKFADAAASKIREVLGFTKKDGGTMERLIPKHLSGKPVERQDNTNVRLEKRRNLTKELYSYYNNLINKAFPTTFEKIKLDLINRGILSEENSYSVPVGHLGDGYRSVVVSPEILYGPYDLPLLTINGWGRTLDPEYPDEEQWKDIARKTIQNDSTLSLSDATKYMWALDHPEFKLHPMFRSMATPIQPGPWDRMLYTSGEYEGYLPSDNPKYGGDGTMSYGWDYPSRSTTYKTTKYPPEDWHNKEHLYNWLDKFYNRKNGINK